MSSYATYTALAVSYAALAAAIVLIILRARRRAAAYREALFAYTAATARAVARNGGCGLVWHELDLLKHGMTDRAVTAVEFARIRLEEKTGLTAGKRPKKERDILRQIKKFRALNARRGRLTVSPVGAGEGGEKA